MLIRKTAKKETMEGTELLNQEGSENSEDEKVEVLGNSGSRHYQTM